MGQRFLYPGKLEHKGYHQSIGYEHARPHGLWVHQESVPPEHHKGTMADYMLCTSPLLMHILLCPMEPDSQNTSSKTKLRISR